MQELEHTTSTLAAMETSQTRLAKTNTEYGNQSGLLGMSKRLLGVLHRQSVQVRR